MRPTLVLTILFALAAPAVSQTEAPCPLHAEHQKAESHAGHALDQRGDKVMGFEHSRTTHHFRLANDGGAIEVEANDPGDTASLTQIRTHLSQVAEAFSKGDFTMPGEIHGRTLPGIPEMTRRKDAISYRYEETERGARVRITAADSAALDAVHAFLRAQIEDHRTGDPLTPSP